MLFRFNVMILSVCINHKQRIQKYCTSHPPFHTFLQQTRRDYKSIAHLTLHSTHYSNKHAEIPKVLHISPSIPHITPTNTQRLQKYCTSHPPFHTLLQQTRRDSKSIAHLTLHSIHSFFQQTRRDYINDTQLAILRHVPKTRQ